MTDGTTGDRNGDGGDAVERLSRAVGRLRLMIRRRVLGQRALQAVAPTLDLADLDVLAMVPAEGDASGAEVIVGDVARALRIDPSRASRLVAGLVAGGFLRRVAVAHDGRRSVLRRTATGDAIFAEIRRAKSAALHQILHDWPPERREAFARDLEAFVSGWEDHFTR